MPRILLIDDDAHLAPPLATYLKRFDFELVWAGRPSLGLARLREDGLVTFRRDSQTLHYSVIDQRALRVLAVLKDIYCGDLA